MTHRRAFICRSLGPLPRQYNLAHFDARLIAIQTRPPPRSSTPAPRHFGGAQRAVHIGDRAVGICGDTEGIYVALAPGERLVPRRVPESRMRGVLHPRIVLVPLKPIVGR
jgi:hypothetical protein